MNKFYLLFCLFFLTGCAVRSVNPNAFKYMELNELSARYQKNELGKVEIFTVENFNDRSSLSLYGRNELKVDIGNIGSNEGFIIYLPENSYMFWPIIGLTKISPEPFKVKGGQTITYKWEKVGQTLMQVSAMPNSVKILSAGSVYNKNQIDARQAKLYRERQPKFKFSYDEPKNGFINLTIKIEEISDIEKLYINEVEVATLLKTSDGVIKSYEKVSFGYNTIKIKVVNRQGYETVDSFNVRVLSEQEKKEITENARLEKLRIEKEATAKKMEEERIAREGDGSPDDLLCKKYGLKPQTSGYAECRMRIDIAKAENKKRQEQYEQEQTEYERRLAEIKSERQRELGLRQMELGLRMMGGQSPINAINSLGTGMPIAPTRPSPINQTITLPGGRMINCTTVGTMTNCF